MTVRQQARSIRVPQVLRLIRSPEAAVQALSEFCQAASPQCLLIHSGDASGTGYGGTVAREAKRVGIDVDECVVRRNDYASVADAVAVIEASNLDMVIGVGGGRVVDVAKLAAARCDLPYVAMPTQAASDGICSPVAVIVRMDGRPESVAARIPAAVIVDMDVLGQAPLESWRSGLGDLVSNLSAVLDWRTAEEQAGEEVDDFACLTAEAAALSVVRDDADLTDPSYQQLLVRGLILSGIAMEMAGSSRPASGSEHLISHALDRMLDQPRAHGLQVALATVATAVLRGAPVRDLIRFYRGVGLPVSPSDLGISVDAFLAALDAAPSTRPGRWTMLDRVTARERAELKAWYASDAASGDEPRRRTSLGPTC